jgi:putative oxidoreductase
MNNQALGKLIFRVVLSLMMLTHGVPKLMRLFSGNFAFPDPIGIGQTPSLMLAVFAEVICVIFIIVGYRTKIAAIPMVITMAVAAFIQHGGDSWGDKEPALLYGLGFLTITLIGAGKYSIDKK